MNQANERNAPLPLYLCLYQWPPTQLMKTAVATTPVCCRRRLRGRSMWGGAEAIIPVCQRMWRQDGGRGGGGGEGAAEVMVDRLCGQRLQSFPNPTGNMLALV